MREYGKTQDLRQPGARCAEKLTSQHKQRQSSMKYNVVYESAQERKEEKVPGLEVGYVAGLRQMTHLEGGRSKVLGPFVSFFLFLFQPWLLIYFSL